MPDKVVFERILAKHGFGTDNLVPAPIQGESNFTWLTVDAALRIPRTLENDPGLLTESISVPPAVGAGVLTPRLLVLDEDRDIVPTLAAIYERMPGMPMALFDWSKEEVRRLAGDVAEELAKLHESVHKVDDPANWLQPTWLVDYEKSLSKAEQSGFLSPDEVKLAQKWAEQLTPIEPSREVRFLHHDIHALNLLVSPEKRLTAILDWSDAGWGDVAGEFPMLPAWMLPEFVCAYQTISGGQEDIEGRVMRIVLEVTLDHVAGKETGLPLFNYGRSAWDAIMRLREEERSDLWRQWMP